MIFREGAEGSEDKRVVDFSRQRCYFDGMSEVMLAATLVVGLALFFDFTNGFNDSANQVATVITSNAMQPATALFVAGLGNFVGAYFLGTAIAETLGKGIVNPDLLIGTGVSGAMVVFAALLGAVAWNLISWRLGVPSSSSHALIGGLLGAFIVGWGFGQINWDKVVTIVAIMILSPIIGFVTSYLFTRGTITASNNATPSINKFFRRLQIFSLSATSLAHGTNDAQKTMGVITFALIILGLHSAPEGSGAFVPKWVILSASIAPAIGTMTGGWRIIKTLGSKLYRVRPIHAFSSQVVSAAIIYGTAIFGFPISTTQVISSSVMGAGAASRFKMVRWLVAKDMGLAWLITIPSSAAVAAITLLVIRTIF